MTIARCLAGLIAATVCVACQQDQGPEIVISEVRILAPVAATGVGVAYLTIDNRGATTIDIEAAQSPQFDRVEMHETIDENGTSRMRPLAVVSVPPGGSTRFTAGGKHFMLIGAREGVSAGSPVTIELVHSAGLLLVSATMQARLPSN